MNMSCDSGGGDLSKVATFDSVVDLFHSESIPKNIHYNVLVLLINTLDFPFEVVADI